MVNPSNLLVIAQQAAKKAGTFLIEEQTLACQVNSSEHRDVKLKGDHLSESIIIDTLQQNSSLAILSEEKGIIGNYHPKDPIWIVDPLDGSLNYSQGIPFCCISIALWMDQNPILGVVYDFFRNELFSGINGTGAWLNDEIMRISDTKKRENSILCTGFPIRTDFSESGLQEFIQQIQSYKKVRLLGSAALSLAYVACGRADAYSENNIMLWDVAGGCALVKAAGGTIHISEQNELLTPKYIFANNNSNLSNNYG